MSVHRPLHRAALAALLLAVLQLTAGCSAGSTGTASTAPSASPTGYVVVTEAAIRPGDAVPSPAGEVVLTVDGPGLARPVEFDTETLEQLGLVEYAADDKQALGRTATFRGVLLSSVLDAVGAGSATVLHATAVNDYTVDIPAADASAYPVLIATSVDGERMSVEKYGPLRIIYPTENVTLDPTVYDPRWIWQLTDITLE